MGRYAGEEYQERKRCKPEDHRFAMNGNCWDCGLTKEQIVAEAELVLKLNKRGKLGTRVN